MSYTELQVTSNFSFLRGASHPEELVEQAAAYGRLPLQIPLVVWALRVRRGATSSTHRS